MATTIRVVETSFWIEWLTGSAIGKKLGRQMPEKPHCVVPTIVQLELSKWLVREVGEEKADQVIAYTQQGVVIPLDTSIALLAADLLTCDPHFEGLPGVALFPKSSTR